jgi:ORF6N domain
MESAKEGAPVAELVSRIRLVRRQRVLIDADLAALYGVPTHRLNEAVKRNAARFPGDFAFRLGAEEAQALISQIAISKPGRGGRRKPPLVFTEHGAIMAAAILNSERAIQTSVYIVRAFVRLRALLASHPNLATKLADLERSVAGLDRSTKEQFEAVYAAIQALTPARLPGRPIGFTAEIE